MAFFKKNNKAQETDQPPRNPNNVVLFRALAVGYVGYLCIQLVQMYVQGGPDAPSLPLLIGSVAVLGGGATYLGIVTYKEWKKNKASYEAYMDQMKAEAKATREAEEAEEARLREEDEYYEALEAQEAEAAEENSEE